MTHAKKRTALFWILAVLWSLPVLVVAQDQHMVLAVISDVEGEVLLSRSNQQEARKAVFGTQLYKGDQLETERKSSVTVLFSNGNLINLGPKSQITVSGNPLVSQGKSIGAELAGSFSDLALQRDSKGEMGVLIALRSDEASQQILPVSPCNTMITTSQPVFSWESTRPADEYVIRLYNSQGQVWEKRTKDTTMDYPDDESPLEYGTSYFWSVEGEDLIHSFRSLNQKFTLLTRDRIDAVKLEEDKLLQVFSENPDCSSHHSLLGTFYARIGLYEDAIGEFELVRDANPDATLPHEILGRLYNDVGKKDLAIAELQEALNLEKEKQKTQ